MQVFRSGVLLTALLLCGCASVRSLLPSRSPVERLAASVTIVRDEWGVPHILGATDASVAFGLAYAQAEDNFWQIEEDYLRALGRASHWYGERYLASDLLQAAFEVERLAREEYAREPADRRAVWDAFAAGLNYYMRTSGVRPRLITNYEPWMPFALARAVTAGVIIDGVRVGGTADTVRSEAVQLVGAWVDTAGTRVAATSLWAVAPSRTAAGHALFLHSSAGEFSSASPYEMTVVSSAGWHVSGYARLGTPVPQSGHNERLAWGHAESAADHADVYEVTFDHPNDPLLYRWDGAWRRAVEWEDTLQVNSPAGVAQRVFRFRRTHHGPIVARRAGAALAVRVARMEDGGSLQQWYAMGRSLNLDDFRAALGQRALAVSTMLADVDGNIFYLHGNAVPARDTTFDWRKPVDGSTPAAEWRGYHELAELPQVLNPAGGWIHSTDAGPFHVSESGDDRDPTGFPGYMVAGAGDDDGRADAARRLLRADSSWTFDEWAAAPFDTFVADAAAAIAALAGEWEQVGGQDPERARRLDDAIDRLRSWDHVATLDSESATLFVLWQERLRASEYAGEFARFRALESVIMQLERDWGSMAVSWGELNRLQRVMSGDRQAFSDDRPSLPIAGVPGWTGVVFAFSARDVAGARRRYGVRGTSRIAAVEVAPAVRSRSVVPFGQSADPSSPHWFDQASLYARGELKAARFQREEVMSNARRTYQPSRAVRELP